MRRDLDARLTGKSTLAGKLGSHGWTVVNQVSRGRPGPAR